MANLFEKTFHARWGDMDFNAHMCNTAYLDAAADVRMLYFESCGFSMRRFEELRLGAVVMKDEIEYFKEIRLLEAYRVNLMLAGLSADGSRFKLRNEVYRADGKRAAVVTSWGGWFDQSKRALVAPPTELFEALTAITKSTDFAELPNSTR